MGPEPPYISSRLCGTHTVRDFLYNYLLDRRNDCENNMENYRTLQDTLEDYEHLFIPVSQNFYECNDVYEKIKDALISGGIAINDQILHDIAEITSHQGVIDSLNRVIDDFMFNTLNGQRDRRAIGEFIYNTTIYLYLHLEDMELLYFQCIVLMFRSFVNSALTSRGLAGLRWTSEDEANYRATFLGRPGEDRRDSITLDSSDEDQEDLEQEDSEQEEIIW